MSAPAERHIAVLLTTALFVVLAACSTLAPGQEIAVPRSTPTSLTSTIAVNGTSLHVEQHGAGTPLLLIHGGGEDAGMLVAQARALAAAGYRVISYDRRGTGRSGRDAWPGGGADQHADDAAALLDALDATPATVLGVSSGGVIAMAVAIRHQGRVRHVVAWEPPASGVLPDAAESNAAIMAPIDAHLRTHPGDYPGAQAILLTEILGFPVTIDDPAFAAARANAEPMIRDEPTIVAREFDAVELAAAPITVAVGSDPNPLVDAAVTVLGQLRGRDPVVIDGADHEIYLTDPQVLTRLVGPPPVR